jgi:hypothetical protein
MRTLALAIVLTALSYAQAARAQPSGETDQCIEQHAGSQKLRKNGSLLAAQKLLLSCSRQACPGPIRTECSQWAQEVEASIPTMLIEVSAADGSLLGDVEVYIDGELREQKLSGLPLAVDPGEHQIEVRPRGEEPRKRKVLVVLDDKRRRVRIEAPASTAATAKPVETEPGFAVQAPGAPAIIVGSLGVGGLIVGTVFGVRALEQASELEKCRPDCDRDDAEAMHREAIASDVALWTGVALIGVATIVWLTQPSEADGSGAVASALSGRFSF